MTEQNLADLKVRLKVRRMALMMEQMKVDQKVCLKVCLFFCVLIEKFNAVSKEKVIATKMNDRTHRS